MNIELPPDQQAFLMGLAAAGRFGSVDEAILEGVDLLIQERGDSPAATASSRIVVGAEQETRPEKRGV
ncbi:MAG: type II toxin-antitoxin system ParD family antitoxin [Thermoguttaceae bacterium]